MEDLKKIIKTIKKALAGTAYEGTPILSAEFEEPIKRPSIKVMIPYDTTVRMGLYHFNNKKSIKIYYFAKSAKSWRCENMEVGNIISQSLIASGITQKTDVSQPDKVLLIEFLTESDIFPEEYSVPENPMEAEEMPVYDIMEELDIDIEKK